MKIGFTGTRHGMTPAQKAAVAELLQLFKSHDTELHHGDCVGADADAHDLAGRINAIRVVHPPADDAQRAGVLNYDQIREPKTHFARNRDIVDETSKLIACPPYETPITKATRGGTAYTVNYARKRGKQICIVWPSGKLTREFPDAPDQIGGVA